VVALRSWISALVVFASGASGGEEVARLSPLRMALLDFEDRAGFQGKWSLAEDVPEFLGRYLDRADAFDVVPRERVDDARRDRGVTELKGLARAVAVGRLLDVDIVVRGVVEKFGMRRITAGDPNLVGYKSYQSRIRIAEVEVIRVATEEVMGTVEAGRDSTERPLGLDLFGRPRKQDREFRELFAIEFGSERFFELPLGILADAVFEDLSRDIMRLLVDRPPIDLSSDKAVVLAVDRGEVYLGIGVEDNVEYGDVLPLYRAKERVALVKVSQVIGSHLCKATIIEGVGDIETGQRIGQRLSRAEGVE